jgi:hypothetical protein
VLFAVPQIAVLLQLVCLLLVFVSLAYYTCLSANLQPIQILVLLHKN